MRDKNAQTFKAREKRFEQKVGVFEEAEAAEVEDEPANEYRLLFRREFFQTQTNRIIDQRQSEDQETICGFPVHVEKVACHQKQCRPEAVGHHPIEDDYRRQKQHVCEAVEEHFGRVFVSGLPLPFSALLPQRNLC